MSFEVVRSKIVYRGPVFNVRQDFLRLPNGNLAQMDVVEHRGGVTILPVDHLGQIWFIRQYRHPVQRKLLELPAGAAELDEDPQSSAQRELREEIGMAAEVLQKIGAVFLAPGYSSELMHIFLATELYPSPLSADDDEYLEIEKISVGQAMNLAETGGLDDSKSVIALFFARSYLKSMGLLD